MVVQHMSSLVLLEARTRDSLLLPLQATMNLADGCHSFETKATLCTVELPMQPFTACCAGTMQHA